MNICLIGAGRIGIVHSKNIYNNKKINFKPSNTIIKSNEKSIIENNENFIVINKDSGISVQGGTKSKKNLIDIFKKSKIFKMRHYKKKIVR